MKSPVQFTTGKPFTELNLHPATIEGLKAMGITNATDIQEKSIPIIMQGKSIIAQAQTGSGKTLAYSIPQLETVDKSLKSVQSLILVPTRELCKQVAKVFEELSKNDRVDVVEVYGGVSVGPQMDAIQRGAQVVVATPGRLMDIHERGIIRFDHVKYITLDEADRMLDMGFFPDIEDILDKVNANTHGRPIQFMLFSATIMEEIKQLASTFMGTYEEVNVSQDDLTVSSTGQFYYLIKDRRRKYEFFKKILQAEPPQHAIIFTNTKNTAEFLERRLTQERNMKYRIRGLHGNMGQASREKVLIAFKKREFEILIATDVAARGLDIDDVDYVFQYDVPQYEENYVHRIGRTSRMGKVGAAVMLGIEDEYAFICRIEGYINKTIVRKHLPGEDQYAQDRKGDGDRRGNYDRRGGYESRGGDHRGQRPRGPREGRRESGPSGNDDENSYGLSKRHPFF